MTEPEFSPERLLESYASAVAAKDAAALMNLYDSNARVFDAWERWSYEGASAWGTAVHNWLGSLGAESVRVNFEDTQTSSAQELAVVSTIVTYTSLSAESRPLRSMQNRLTWVVRLSGSGPRIIHEHSSAPIDFNGMKAILQR